MGLGILFWKPWYLEGIETFLYHGLERYVRRELLPSNTKHWTIESKYLKQRRDHIDGDDSDDNDRDDNDRDDDDSDDDYLEDWEQEYVSVFLVLKRMPVDF